jgi:hypothetical protein
MVIAGYSVVTLCTGVVTTSLGMVVNSDAVVTLCTGVVTTSLGMVVNSDAVVTLCTGVVTTSLGMVVNSNAVVGLSTGVVSTSLGMVVNSNAVVTLSTGVVVSGLRVVYLRTLMIGESRVTLLFGIIALVLRVVALIFGVTALLLCVLRLLIRQRSGIVSVAGSGLRLRLQRGELIDAGGLLGYALCLILLSRLFMSNARFLILYALLLVCDTLLFVGYALRFVGIGWQRELNLRSRLACEVEHHLVPLPVYLGGDIGGIDHLVLSVIGEIGHSEMVSHLILQLTNGQVVVVELHHELRRFAWIVGAMRICLAVPTDKESL